MKINDTSLHQAGLSQVTGTQQVQSGHGAKKTGSAGSADGDQVQISSLSGRLVEMLSPNAPDRVAKVAQLAADFKAGNYHPNSAGTARGMVTESMSNGA